MNNTNESYDIPINIASTDGIGPSHDFVVKFDDPIRLPENMDHLIALRMYDGSCSWYNISRKNKNNKIRVSKNRGVDWADIIFVDGNYSYLDIQSFLDFRLRSDGLAHSDTKLGVQLTFEKSTFQCLLTLEDDYHVDLTQSDFGDLIGFNKRIVTGSSNSDFTPNITYSLDSINTRTSIISSSVGSGNQNDVLFHYSTDGLSLTYPYHIEPIHLSFNKINTTTIREMRIYLTTPEGRIVDLNNSPINLSLLLRSVPR